MTEEQMLDYFQKNAVPHAQVGGKLRVMDFSTLPGGFRQYFNESGFFVDTGQKNKAVEREVAKTIKAEAIGAEPPAAPDSQTPSETPESRQTTDSKRARKKGTKKR